MTEQNESKYNRNFHYTGNSRISNAAEQRYQTYQEQPSSGMKSTVQKSGEGDGRGPPKQPINYDPFDASPKTDTKFLAFE